MNLTKDDKIKNLLALKEEIDRQIADLMLKQKEKWEPEGIGYTVQANGRVEKDNEPLASYCEFGSTFEEKEQAEKASEAYRKYHRLYKLAEELNPPDWDTDWSDSDQEKFGLNYDHLQDQWRVLCFYQTSSPGSVYFASKERAEQAIKILEEKGV